MKKKIRRLLACVFALTMILTTVAPAMEASAATSVADSIEVNDPIFNATTGVMKYAKADGYGTGLYKSIVICFTSVRTNNEYAKLPTTLDGFNYNDSISNESTYVINMPAGKTLPEVATYIRRIEFYNCQNSSQKIKFSIGKQEVKYMTLYCEATQHYYQYVPFTGSTKTWLESYDLAKNMTYEGLTGYLVTVTSESEDYFLFKAANAVGWMGGTSMGKGTIDGMYMTCDPNSYCNYWYWACGPEVGQTFFDYKKAGSTSTLTSQSSKYYFNWDANTPEPNGEATVGGECCLTTLNFGNGFATHSTSTSGLAGAYTSDILDANVYGWNDIIYDRNNGDKYCPSGFFVEYGDATTGLKEGTKMTNYEFNTVTKAITHTWEYTSEPSTNADANDTIAAFCTLDNPKCSYYGSASYHSTVVQATLKTPDMAKNGSAYNLATFTGGETLATTTGGTLSSVKYYKSTVNGATSGGTALTEAPSTPGYYYAEVTISNSSTNNNTATAVSPFTIYDPNADYSIESINNKGGEGSDGSGSYAVTQSGTTITYEKVTGSSDAKSDLEVVLNTPADQINLYKIADYTWTGSTLSEPTWNETVQDWVDASSTYKTIAATPTKLSTQSSSVWSDFYKQLLKASGNISSSLSTYRTTYDTTTYQTASGSTYQATTATSTDDTIYSYTYKDVEPGIYAVLATKGSGGTQYAVTIAAVTPQRTGPKSTYVMQTLYTVYIKQSEATLSKTINTKKEDSLEIGELVDFAIKFELPDYYDRVQTSDSAANGGYTLKLTDTMSKAYTIKDGTLKLYYLYADGSSTPVETLLYSQASGDTGYTTIPTAAKSYLFYNAQNSGNTRVQVTTGNQSTYTTNDEMVGKYAEERTNTPLFATPVITKGTTTDTTIVINFDEPAVRAWTEAKKSGTKSVTGYVLKYQATLDQDAEVNSQNNYNKAALTVEDNLAGTKTKDIEDVVYGYTYGLKIVKIDGDTYGTDSQKYIAGAKFKLYKEVAAYSSSTTGTTTNYTFLGDTAKTTSSETDPLIEALGVNTTTYTEAQDQENQVIAKAKANSSYYVYEQSNIALTGDGLVNDTVASFDKTDTTKHVALSTGMNLTRIYKQVVLTNGVMDTNGIITSVNKAEGVTCHGLGEGTYILVESAAPIGYNELSEDMYFEINELTADEELGTGINTLQQFREDLAEKTTIAAYTADTTYKTATYSTDALITLDVLNYAGLTLPSTGGIGILIFVIIGVAIMGSVIVIIVKRRRAAEEEEE